MSRTDGIKRVAAMMRALDFCMFTTHADDDTLRARPMSNNGEVEFDGDVWFFSGAETRKVAEIIANPEVQLNYADTARFRFVSLTGTAEIVRDVDKKRDLWLDELKRWFEDGPESDDIVLIKVTPRTVEYWSGEENGAIDLS